MTAYPCPICDGEGVTRTDSILRIDCDCDLCDGEGVLRVPLAALALRFKRKAAMAADEIRHLRRTLDNRHEGAATGGLDNGSK
jgi:hypothetical protein